jgi:hypothetical protein
MMLTVPLVQEAGNLFDCEVVYGVMVMEMLCKNCGHVAELFTLRTQLQGASEVTVAAYQFLCSGWAVADLLCFFLFCTNCVLGDTQMRYMAF